MNNIKKLFSIAFSFNFKNGTIMISFVKEHWL